MDESQWIVSFVIKVIILDGFASYAFRRFINDDLYSCPFGKVFFAALMSAKRVALHGVWGAARITVCVHIRPRDA